MLITNTKSLRNFFKTFENRQFGDTKIASVFYGDYDRILTQFKKTRFKYPLLWVERADIQLIEKGGSKKRFKFALSILQNTGNITEAEEDEVIDKMETLITEILEALEIEGDEDSYEFEQTDTNIQFIPPIGSDLAVGCRAEIELIGGRDCTV
jgi:hypothetical protein